MLLPLVGSVTTSILNEEILQEGEMQVIFTPGNSSLRICNAYENQLVSFLKLWFRYPDSENLQKLTSFDLEKNKNHFIQVFDNHIKLSIGKFDRRSYAIYKLSGNNAAFVFIIQEAFEVQHRCLKPGMGLP